MKRLPGIPRIFAVLLLGVVFSFTSLSPPKLGLAAEDGLPDDPCSLQYYIDPDTGRLVLEDVDRFADSPQTVTRTWREGSSGGDLFGAGWHFRGESTLDLRPCFTLARTGNGRCLALGTVVQDTGSGCIPPADCPYAQDESKLEFNDASAVLEERASGLQWHYDLAPDMASGRLAAFGNPRLGMSVVTYSQDGAINSVADGQGRRIDFQTDTVGRCVFASSEGGSSIRYEYDDRGNLSDVFGSDGHHTTYRYCDDGDLISAVCQGRVTTILYSGTGSGKRCVTVSGSRSSGSDATIALTGAPDIVLQPYKLAFGKVPRGEDAKRNFKIINSGTAALTVTKIGKAGLQTADFTVSGFAPTTLNPGQSLTPAVTFKPAALGDRKAYLVVFSNDPDAPQARVSLSGTGIAAPKLLEINAEGTADDRGKIGQKIKLIGQGFSQVAAENEVSFSGTTAKASIVAKHPSDPLQQVLTVAVPPGAKTGALTVRWLGGSSKPSNALTFTLLPTASVTLKAGMEAGGVYTGAYPFQPHYFFTEPNLCWVLGGSGFSKTSSLAIEITFATGDRVYKKLFPVSDTFAYTDSVQNLFWDGSTMQHFPGETFTLQVRALDKATGLLVLSNPLQLSIADHYIPGGVWSQDATFPYAKTILSRGDYLIIKGAGGSRQNLQAPGLWTGVLPFNGSPDYSATADGIYAKALHMDKAGTFMIYNDTNSKSLEVTVLDEGVASDASWATDTCVDGALVAERGAVLGFGGGRLVIPPGALPLHDGSGFYQLCGRHKTSTAVPIDTARTDGGHTFKIRISGYEGANDLLKPIVITLPYSAKGRVGMPEFGLWDPVAADFLNFKASVNTIKKTVSIVAPAGHYGHPASVLASPGPTEASMKYNPGLPTWPALGLSVDKLLEHIAPVSFLASVKVWKDDTRGLQLDFVDDPASSNFVSDDLADLVWTRMAGTYDYLTDRGWRVPDGLLHWSIRNLGAYQCNGGIGTGGATTRGVLGEPMTFVNRQTAQCGDAVVQHIATHEMGHAFQRQYATNIRTYWIDEAMSEWVSFALNGSTLPLQTDISQGCEFPSLGLPTTFYGSYNNEQQYASGAFAIWLEENYQGLLRSLYEAGAENPLIWAYAHGQLESLTGQPVRNLVDAFAKDYWTQSFNPVRGITLNPSNSLVVINGWEGANTGNSFQPPLSSRRFSFSATAQFEPSLAGRDLVARATGLNNYDQYVYVYHDTAKAAQATGKIGLIGVLSKDFPEILLGTAGGAYNTWRFVFVNKCQTEGYAWAVRVVSPHIASLSPTSGSHHGGYSVTINGMGFGDAPETYGRVLIGGVQCAVTSWSDTSVTFTMPGLGSATGAWNVRLYTKENARSNYGTFTLTN